MVNVASQLGVVGRPNARGLSCVAREMDLRVCFLCSSKASFVQAHAMVG